MAAAASETLQLHTIFLAPEVASNDAWLDWSLPAEESFGRGMCV